MQWLANRPVLESCHVQIEYFCAFALHSCSHADALLVTPIRMQVAGKYRAMVQDLTHELNETQVPDNAAVGLNMLVEWVECRLS